MGYREEAIECVKDHVLQLHRQIYAKYDGDFFILSQLEPDSQFDVRIENTILRGGDRCTFRMTRHAGMKRETSLVFLK